METQRTTTQVTSATPTIVPTPGDHPMKTYTQKKAIFRLYQIIWYLLGVIEVLLLFRIILKILAANPSSGFVSFIYTLSNPLAQPFRGIFQTAVVEGSVFEWSTILAGIVYAIIAYGLVQLFQLVKPTNPQEIEENITQ